MLKDTKICSDCSKEKDITCFYSDSSSKDGKQSRCSVCTKIRNKEFKDKNKDYFKLKNKEIYEKNIESDKDFNAKRYLKYQEKFVSRSREYKRTPFGRFMSLLTSARKRARDKGVKFLLSVEWLKEQWEYQNGCCKLTGIPFNLDSVKHRNYNPFAPSLDAIDPTKGYTPENTRLVCTAINIALNAWGEEVYYEVSIAYLKKKGLI